MGFVKIVIELRRNVLFLSMKSTKEEDADGLENAMTTAIKEQAKKKQYTWN